MHNSQAGPPSASVGSHASPQDPAMSGSHFMRADQGESSHNHHHQQQQQQQSDIIGVTEQTENNRGLSQSGTQSPILNKEISLCIQVLLVEHAFKCPAYVSFYTGPCNMSRQQQ